MTRFAYSLGCAVALPIMMGCSSSPIVDERSTSSAAQGSDGGATTAPSGDGGTLNQCGTINSSIGAKFIEIETALPPNSTTCRGQTLANGAPYNANLHVGTAENPGLDYDPLDDVPHAPAGLDFDDCSPVPGSGTLDPTTYIDWDDLSGLSGGPFSCNDGTNDTSAFGSGSCVTVGSSPKKADITGVAFASNKQDLYLALARRDNNGDVSFTYVFTKSAMNPVACSGGFVPNYALQANDIVIHGSYPQSSGAVPVIDAWKYAASSSSTMDPATLIQSLPASGNSNATWTNVSSVSSSANGIAAAANIDYTQASNVLPYEPVATTSITTADGAKVFLLDQIALEMAVPMAALVGGSFDVCNPGSFHVDVISQSSSSATSALQDYIGGIVLNLGSMSLTASAKAGCDANVPGAQELDLEVTSLTSRDGTSVTEQSDGSYTGYSCSWSCTGPGGATASASTCKATIENLAAGDWSCTVSVQESSGDQCSAKKTPDKVTIYPRIGASPSMTGSCANTFGWDAGVDTTTGSGSLSCSWSFSGTGATLPGASLASDCSYSGFSAGGPFATGGVTIQGSVTVTDSTTSCARTFGPASAKVYSPPTLAVTAPTSPLACTSTPALSSTNDTMAYTATVSRGASPTVGWTGCTSTSGNQCSVQFADSDYCDTDTVTASVTDSACSTQLPASLSYQVSKTTTLSSASK